MIQRWSNRLTEFLRANLRRGALFVLGGMMALTFTLSPVMSQPAKAQGISDLLSLGGSFTNGLSSCAIETIGWVVCPTMRSIARLADYGFAYINKNFLRIDYNLTANNSGTYKAWELMRNIANGLFVVAFMVLIYSQLTGRGAGGYNIKRMLPRLILAAVAVNLSYFLCVILIEVTNIVGDSILAIFAELSSRVGRTIMPIGGASNSSLIAAFQDGTLTVLTTSVLSKTGVAWVLLAPVAAVTISIATISAVMLVLLIMRKTVVAMLILASPILFVAYLLPNLERFFFQGARLFVQLLVLYPIIALLLGTGQVVSATIVSVGSNDANYRVSGDSYFARNGGSGSAITDLTAAAAAVLPLLGVWFIFKNMNSIMNTAGSRLSASIRGRQGSGDKDARVTGQATKGAANVKGNAGIAGAFNRRQAFSRNKRKRSIGESSLTGEDTAGSAIPAQNRRAGIPESGAALQNAFGNTPNAGTSAEDEAKRLEDLQAARLEGQASGIDADTAVAAAMAADQAKDDTPIKTEQEDKAKTAKDIFNNLNRGHESKDKDRKLGAGPQADGGSGQAVGTAQPSAPSTSYRAPSIAQSGNIGSSQQPAQVIAVPVQIDGSALLGKSTSQQPPEAMSQPPISGTEEKAKARAQKYIFDSERDIKETEDRIDIFGGAKPPTEPPHSPAPKDKGSDE